MNRIWNLNVKMLHLTLPFMDFHCPCHNFTTVIDILVNEEFTPGNYSYFTFSNVTTLFKNELNPFFPQITPNTQYRQHEKFVFKLWQPPQNKHTNKQNQTKIPLLKYLQPLHSTLLMHLWQQLQPQVFVNVMPQAWHIYLSPVPLLHLRSSVELVGKRRCTDKCQISPETFGWIQVWALAGPLKDIYSHLSP